MIDEASDEQKASREAYDARQGDDWNDEGETE